MAVSLPYQLLANAVLVLHFLLVVFVIGGLLMIVMGNLVRWNWVNNWWFRCLHLAAIGVVVMQSWVGIDCPLTVLESWLRTKAGLPVYAESFIEHWLGRWLYYAAPWWVFVTLYSLFGLLVAAAWWQFPPGRNRPGKENPA